MPPTSSKLLIILAIASPVCADDVFFERDVRPILKEHCFQCHGESGETEGGLDLRLRRLIADGGESGAAIVASDPASSLLLDRVRSGEMPPGDDKRLSAREIATLKTWIEQGARTAREEPAEIGDAPIFTEEERSYWAFQPVVSPEVPELPDTSRVRTPVDAFVLSRQNSFESDAEGHALIRRAYFDLIGLPPSPKSVDEFVADFGDVAWHNLIDELLSSKHYGERWGRHWLDVVGYADSEGYSDEDRVRPHAWRYRDYVIRSFNNDKPFDLFVQEQLAGDEMVPSPHRNLSPEAIEKLTATGFLRMAPDGTASGGIDKPLAQNQVIADTVQIVGSSLLGLTVNCAQCHDHRYDPIPTADYYRLRAIFEPAFNWKKWKTPAGRQISLYTDEDRAQAAEIEAQAVAVEKERQKKADGYITRTLEEELLLVPVEKRDALRVAYRTVAKDRDEEQKALLKEFPSVASISVGSLYLFDRRRDVRAGKLDAERKSKEKLYLEEASKKAGTKVTRENLAKFAPEAAAELQQLADEAQQLRNSKAAVDLKKFADKAAEIRGRKPVEGFVRALAESPGTVPATFVFYRGDHEQPKAEIQPGGLSIIGGESVVAPNDPALPTTGRRLAFAKFLTSGQHPLFARVIVNRIWLHHFGRGLVNSPGDFGVLGSRPSHPKLLDWLAAEFVDSGWSVKHIHRLIMRSSTYRQAPAQGIPAFESEYFGYPLRRLESEIIRDAILFITGLLNDSQFGEPVPVMEDAVGQIVIGKENLDGERKPTKTVALDGQEYRRSIYIQVRRTRTLSMFETFDAPTLTPNCDKRSTSTATPQSLLLMNSDFAVKVSAAFAKRVLRESSADDHARVNFAWRLAYGAAPTKDETTNAVAFVSEMRNQLAEKDPKRKDEERLQEAFAVFCQALLSSSKFLYVE